MARHQEGLPTGTWGAQRAAMGFGGVRAMGVEIWVSSGPFSGHLRTSDVKGMGPGKIAGPGTLSPWPEGGSPTWTLPPPLPAAKHTVLSGLASAIRAPEGCVLNA